MAAAGIQQSATARAHGFLVGFVVAYALSISRLLALHFTLRYAPAAWEALHGLVLPLGPVVIVGLYFMHWTADPGSSMRAARPPDAS